MIARRGSLIVLIGLATTGPARAGVYADQDDAAVARTGIKLLSGTLHTVQAVDNDGTATGTFAHTSNDENELRSRLYKIVEAQLAKAHPQTSKYHLFDEAFSTELCLAHALQTKAEAAAHKQCDDEWQDWKQATSYDKVNTDPLLRGLWIGHLADAVGDPAFAAAARADFARTAGFKLLWARLDQFTTTYAMVEPVPMAKWSYPTVKSAIAYAGGDPALTKELEAALKVAPRFHCVWHGGAIARASRGGKLGPVTFAEDITPAADVAGSGGEIACDEVKAMHGDAAALKAVQQKDKAAFLVRTIDQRDWEDMVDDAGHVTRKVRPVQIYAREPY